MLLRLFLVRFLGFPCPVRYGGYPPPQHPPPYGYGAPPGVLDYGHLATDLGLMLKRWRFLSDPPKELSPSARGVNSSQDLSGTQLKRPG